MTTHQYRDLPQIPRSMEDQDCYVWSADLECNGLSYKQQMMGPELGYEFHPDEFDSSMVGLQPMQRFKSDHGSFDPCMLYTNAPSSSPFSTIYAQPWPLADYTRNVSPGCTSVSGLSSHASYSEIHSPTVSYSNTYSNPADTLHHSQAYLSVEDFYGTSHLPDSRGCRTVVNPRDIEYDYQAQDNKETALEDKTELVIERESSSDHESSAIKHEPISVGKEYPNSGIGQPVRDAESVQPLDFPDELASDSDYQPNPRRSNKRKRSTALSVTSSRIIKCRKPGRQDSLISNSSSSTKRSRRRTSSSASRSTCKANTSTEDRRPFPCPFAPYGCASQFVSKNEWKRHVSTQHIKQGFWRCDMCPPTTHPKDGNTTLYYNDFNRVDLFRQHLRRMHAGLPRKPLSRSSSSSSSTKTTTHLAADSLISEALITDHQSRCYHELRAAPLQSSCLFCAKTFCGPTSWTERMDHVGLHLERERSGDATLVDAASWRVDAGLERYLLEEGLIRREAGEWVIGDGSPIRGMRSEECE